jgi:hypothetical protein
LQRVGRLEGRHHDDGQRGVRSTGFDHELDATHSWHPDIGDQKVDGLLIDLRERRGAVVGRVYRERRTGLAEASREGPDERFFVVDEEDSLLLAVGGGDHRGRG